MGERLALLWDCSPSAFRVHAKFAKSLRKGRKVGINELSYVIIGAALRVHSRLGPGLLESVYEEVMADELVRAGLHVLRQQFVPIVFDDRVFEKGYRADLIVEKTVVVEIKSIECVAPVHERQLLTYLRLADYKLGLLLNFNTASLKHGIKRIVNNL